MSIKPSRLACPAQKLYIGQLLKSVRGECDDTANQSSWKYSDSVADFSLVFNQVWVQGIVTATLDRNQVIIDDGTGVVLLTGINKIVKDKTFYKGSYIMAAGALQSNNISPDRPYPVIRVLKIAELSQTLCAESFWILEVIDAQLYNKGIAS